MYNSKSVFLPLVLSDVIPIASRQSIWDWCLIILAWPDQVRPGMVNLIYDQRLPNLLDLLLPWHKDCSTL